MSLITIENVLHVDERKIRSRHDADRFRGLAPSMIVRKLSNDMPQELRQYLVLEVLAPLLVPHLISVKDVWALTGKAL